MTTINMQMGKSALMMASTMTVEKVSSGSLVIDRITGGGWARGRHIELYGDESSGKSLLGYLGLVYAQQRGEIAAVIDAEHVFDEKWFRHLGGDPDQLLKYPSEDEEELTAEDVIKLLMLFGDRRQENRVGFALIDSVASLL